MTNEVKLSGRVYRAEHRMTNSGKDVIKFGLSVYCGKGPDGKSKYNFMNCTYWGTGINDGNDIEITGYLAFDEWEKDGVKKVRPYISVKTFGPQVRNGSKPAQQQNNANDGWDAI